MRHHGRTDANHASVREFFRAHGCEWEDTSNLGNGFPDALAGWGTKIALVEVKAAKGKLEPKQLTFATRFHVWIVRTDADAAACVQWLKS